jgi:uncharacterized protein
MIVPTRTRLRHDACVIWVCRLVLVVATLSPWPVIPSETDDHHESRANVSIAIVIDDLGNSLRDSRRVIGLPGAIACAVLPHTPFATRVAQEAHRQNKEVLLHLPMESLDQTEAGPGALDATMPEREIAITLNYNLETVPYAAGINNHMGSLLTGQAHSMRLLMKTLRRLGDLYFIDSLTNQKSQAGAAAQEFGVPYLVRNVFLDTERSSEAIERRLTELINVAEREGRALGIGHPYAETLETLERWLPNLSKKNVRLVPPSTLIAQQTHGTDPMTRWPNNEIQSSWQPSLSR